MREFIGKSVFNGIAIGPLKIFSKEENAVKRMKVDDPQGEIERFTQAKEQAKAELGRIY
ncbi:MAG: phosphoenolpyruvate--protein phosphotransferase, partial [Lachnospiraceae bacterium]|nr:phosphoenolpyruvate--protein phosphotransferase [Lachnospiraceae bacterium]